MNLDDLDRISKRRRQRHVKRVLRTGTNAVVGTGRALYKGIERLGQMGRESHPSSNRVDLGFGNRERHYRLRRRF